MSSFFSFLPADGWQRLMCDALWQSTLIAGLGWIVARFLLRQSAARAWLLLMTLIACMLVPLASLAARDFGWTVLPLASNLDSRPSAGSVASPSIDFAKYAELASTHDAEADTSVVSWSPDHDTQPTAGLPAAFNATGDLRSVESAGSGDPRTTRGHLTGFMVLELLGVIWVAIALFLAARLALGFVAMRRIVRSAVACDDAELLAAAAEAARRIGVPCPPVLYSRHVETPTIFAFGRSQLLVPPVEASLRDANTVALSTAAIAAPDAAGSISRLGETRPRGRVSPKRGASLGETRPLSEAQHIDWIAAFAHELAHVARGDGWARLAVECIRIALPAQPLIWLLRRSFHTACEEACDDWAVATGSNPIDLADTLTAWINRPKRTVSLVAIGMSSTKVRTMRLLRMRKSPDACLGWACHWLGIPSVVLLIAGLAIAQTPSGENKPKGHDGGGNTKSSRSSIDPATSALPRDNGAPSTDEIEKSIAADSLVALYERRLAQDQSELDQINNLSPEDANLFREQIADLRKRLEKRKADLRPLILKELQEEKANTQRRQISMASARRSGEAPYIIQPRDILVIEAVELVPKKPVLIAPFDQVKIVADPTTTKQGNPISGAFQVDSSGDVVLGPAYGAVKISGLTRSEAEGAVLKQLRATLKDPLVSLVIDESRLENGVTGEHLVSADGSISLGAYGSVEVEGLTTAQARDAIEKQLSDFFAAPEIAVQVKSANSKVYYVVLWFADGNKGAVERVPITGNDTVLDAIAHLKAGIEFSGAKLFIQRQNGGGKTTTIGVDLDRVLEGTDSNHQILPGDRIFVNRRPPATPEAPGGKVGPTPANRKDNVKSSSIPSSDALTPTEKNPAPRPPYVIEPPDILAIDAVRLEPKLPDHIQPLDVLQVDADPTKPDNPVRGLYLVEPGGMLNLGPAYGKVKVGGLTLEEAEAKVVEQLKKIFKDPKVSVTINESGGQQQISGTHLVGPDGTINLGSYGQTYVSGLTIEKAKKAIEKQLSEHFKEPDVSVDIYASNSKVYYVISKGAGLGDNIQRFPVTGNETVIDALAQVGAFATAKTKIWIARPSAQGVDKILNVDWEKITQGGGESTNYQVLPGDRVYIDSPQVLSKDPKKSDAPSSALPNTSNF